MCSKGQPLQEDTHFPPNQDSIRSGLVRHVDAQNLPGTKKNAGELVRQIPQ